MKRTERKIWYRTSAEFFMIFLLCAVILTGYDLLRNRESGREALKQKQNYLYRLLEDKPESQIRDTMYSMDDSAENNFDGNFRKQYYSYWIFSNNGRLLYKSEDKFIVSISNGGQSGTEEMKPEEYLSEKELQILYHALKINEQTDVPPAYRIIYEMAADSEGAVCVSGFILEELEWSKSGADGSKQKAAEDPWLHTVRTWKKTGKDCRYIQTGAKAVLRWQSSAEGLTPQGAAEALSLTFPYLQDGYEEWNYWKNQQWLQEDISYKEAAKLTKSSGLERNSFDGIFTTKGQASIAMQKNQIKVVIRSAGNPIILSAQNLWWTYLMLLLVLGICAGFVGANQVAAERKKVRIEKERLDFINGMAHEIKTPLAVLRMCGDNLRVSSLEGKKEYYLDMMEQKSSDIDELIRQMMYLSQINGEHFSLSCRDTDMNTLVSRAVEKQRPIIEEKNIRLKLMRSPAVWSVDEAYFEQLVCNLVSNAVNYVPDYGLIIIETNKRFLSVENDGEAIAWKDRDRIFEMFYRKEVQKPGRGRHTGFGLYLVNEVAKLHHMNCRVENTERGPKFIVSN